MAQISSKESPHMQQVDLTTLSLPQLTTLKQQLDGELNMFSESLQSLKMAQTKFKGSGDCLEKITPECKGKEILVPLTGSMYVPGKLSDSKHVIIDIGTRYYAEKEIADAKDYFARKVKFVSEQMEHIQEIGLEKSRIRDTIVEVMELKLQQMQQQQQAQAGQS